LREDCPIGEYGRRAASRALPIQGGLMNRKLILVMVAMVLIAGLPATVVAKSDHATLIRVHILHPARPVATANCSNAGTANGGFGYTGWKVAGNRDAHLNLATVPSGLTGVPAQLQASFNAWGGQAGVPDITVRTDGTGTKATANHRYDVMWGRTGGSSIAVTYTWRWNTGEMESDTVFNSRLPWFVASTEGDGCVESMAAYDVQNIATHEFGHTYGLDHPTGDRWETMYAYGYTGETAKRSLATGDLAGINGLY
jgi:Matrixin